MARRVPQPDPNKPLVDDNGVQAQQTRVWTRLITNQAVIFDSGNPEGVIEAEQGASYVDENALPGSVFYIKQKADIGGDKTQGWQLIG